MSQFDPLLTLKAGSLPHHAQHQTYTAHLQMGDGDVDPGSRLAGVAFTVMLYESDVGLVRVPAAPMFVRLTKATRFRAGWFVAVVYFLCVVAPAVALGLGNPAPWLPAAIKPTIAAPVHEEMHGAGSSHEHSGAHADHEDDAGHAGHSHDGQTTPGPCCAMLCLSAIPADLPAIAKPSQPVSVCVSEKDQRLPGEAPPLLYRPPIA